MAGIDSDLLGRKSYKVWRLACTAIEIFAHDIGNRVSSRWQISKANIDGTQRGRESEAVWKDGIGILALRRHISKYG